MILPSRVWWLGLVLCVPFSASTLMAGWQEGNLAHKSPIPLIPRGSLPQRVEEESKGNQLTQAHLKKTAVK